MKKLTLNKTVKYEEKNKTLGPERQMSGAKIRVKLWIWESVSKSGTFEKRGLEACSTQDLPWDSTNATVLWSTSSSSLFSSFIKITRCCPKIQSWDLCNVWPALICGSWAECVKDWSLENGEMMKWSWLLKMRSYSRGYYGE